MHVTCSGIVVRIAVLDGVVHFGRERETGGREVEVGDWARGEREVRALRSGLGWRLWPPSPLLSAARSFGQDRARQTENAFEAENGEGSPRLFSRFDPAAQLALAHTHHGTSQSSPRGVDLERTGGLLSAVNRNLSLEASYAFVELSMGRELILTFPRVIFSPAGQCPRLMRGG